MNNAIADLTKRLDNSSRLNQLKFEYGETLMSEGRYEVAANLFRQIAEAQPTSAIAWYNQGDALAHLERHQEALVCFDRAIENNPNFYAAWTFRGVMLIHLEQPAAALLSCEKALEICPQYNEAWVFRGAALQRLGRYKEAYASFDTATGRTQSSIWESFSLKGILRWFNWNPKPI